MLFLGTLHTLMTYFSRITCIYVGNIEWNKHFAGTRVCEWRGSIASRESSTPDGNALWPFSVWECSSFKANGMCRRRFNTTPFLSFSLSLALQARHCTA